MRLGLLGGTFDPVHLGHLLLAEQCREQCRLDQVWFVPAGTPPHKLGLPVTSGNQRAEMLEFAVAGIKEFAVERLEIRRTGPSFTVDTLRQLRQERPDDELFFLVGADSLTDLPLWREPREIAALSSLIVVNRGGAPLPRLELLEPHVGAEAVSRMQVVQMPGIEISASDIRRRVRAGLSIRYLTPRAVEQYILENQLYQAD